MGCAKDASMIVLGIPLMMIRIHWRVALVWLIGATSVYLAQLGVRLGCVPKVASAVAPLA